MNGYDAMIMLITGSVLIGLLDTISCHVSPAFKCAWPSIVSNWRGLRVLIGLLDLPHCAEARLQRQADLREGHIQTLHVVVLRANLNKHGDPFLTRTSLVRNILIKLTQCSTVTIRKHIVATVDILKHW